MLASSSMVSRTSSLTSSGRGSPMRQLVNWQACQFTNCLMGLPLPEEVNDDVRDTMDELANMLGGNLKSLLPRGVVLSMPSVVAGGDYSLRICGGKAIVERVAYRWPAGVFW